MNQSANYYGEQVQEDISNRNRSTGREDVVGVVFVTYNV